jgi:hypothetical protein
MNLLYEILNLLCVDRLTDGLTDISILIGEILQLFLANTPKYIILLWNKSRKIAKQIAVIQFNSLYNNNNNNNNHHHHNNEILSL